VVCRIRRSKDYAVSGIVKVKKVCVLIYGQEMPVDEMKIFFHQTLVAMSDTFIVPQVTKKWQIP
jgi:hypothetical protein